MFNNRFTKRCQIILILHCKQCILCNVMLYKLSGALCPLLQIIRQRESSVLCYKGRCLVLLSLVPLETTEVLYDTLASVSCVSCGWTDQVSIYSDMGIRCYIATANPRMHTCSLRMYQTEKKCNLFLFYSSVQYQTFCHETTCYAL